MLVHDSEFNWLVPIAIAAFADQVWILQRMLLITNPWLSPRVVHLLNAERLAPARV